MDDLHNLRIIMNRFAENMLFNKKKCVITDMLKLSVRGC